MQITAVRVHVLPNHARSGKLRALAAITLDGALVVRDLRVFEGEQGLFVAMPSRKTLAGEYQEIVFPITAEMRATLQEAVLKQYLQEVTQLEAAAG